MSRADERNVERALRMWAGEAVPAPDAAFVARLGLRLTDGADDAAVEFIVRPGLAPVVPGRRRAGLTAVAAAGALFVAGAAAALGGLTRDAGVRVDPAATTTLASEPGPPPIATPPTTLRATDPGPLRTTIIAGTRPDGAPTSTVAPPSIVSTMDPGTTPTSLATRSSTVRADGPPTSARPPRTTAPPAPTTRAPEPTAPPTTVTTAASTTTEVWRAPIMTMACSAQVVDTRPAVVCEWSEPVGGAASYRLLRGVAGQPSGRVLTAAPGMRRVVDFDAAAGATYLYTAQALDGAGTLLGSSNSVSIAR